MNYRNKITWEASSIMTNVNAWSSNKWEEHEEHVTPTIINVIQEPVKKACLIAVRWSCNFCFLIEFFSSKEWPYFIRLPVDSTESAIFFSSLTSISMNAHPAIPLDSDWQVNGKISGWIRFAFPTLTKSVNFCFKRC